MQTIYSASGEKNGCFDPNKKRVKLYFLKYLHDFIGPTLHLQKKFKFKEEKSTIRKLCIKVDASYFSKQMISKICKTNTDLICRNRAVLLGRILTKFPSESTYESYNLVPYLPPGLHCLYFPDTSYINELSSDGLTKILKNDKHFLRRVLCSGSIKYEKNNHLMFGQYSKAETIYEHENATKKQEEECLVLIETKIYNNQGLSLVDRQKLLYLTKPHIERKATKNNVSAYKNNNIIFVGKTNVIEPLHLFRFSALVYNAHRIHWDLEYAKKVEGYEGLVVQGQLILCWVLSAIAEYILCKNPGFKYNDVNAVDYRFVNVAYSGYPISFFLKKQLETQVNSCKMYVYSRDSLVSIVNIKFKKLLNLF